MLIVATALATAQGHPMELFTLLYGAYKIGRALIDDGKGVDTAVGELVSKFLTPLLAGKNQTLVALDRMEATLGRIETQRHRQGLEVGWASLRDAGAPTRSIDDRRHFLLEALREFRAAAATAPTTEAAVTAHLLIVACWVARGSQRDTLDALTATRQRTLDEIDAQSREYGQPAGTYELFESSEGTLDKLRRRLVLGEGIALDHPAVNAARAKLRSQALVRRDDATALHNEVQQLRKLYGEAPSACAAIMGFHEPGEPVMTPRSSTELGFSVWLSSYPVLSWGPDEVVLDGVRLKMSRAPTITPNPRGTGFALACGVEVSPLEGPVRLSVSPSWPPGYQDSLPAHAGGFRDILFAGFTWQGEERLFSIPWSVRPYMVTQQLPQRVVARQSTGPPRHLVKLAAWDLAT